jgi:hypothetical protein
MSSQFQHENQQNTQDLSSSFDLDQDTEDKQKKDAAVDWSDDNADLDNGFVANKKEANHMDSHAHGDQENQNVDQNIEQGQNVGQNVAQPMENVEQDQNTDQNAEQQFPNLIESPDQPDADDQVDNQQVDYQNLQKDIQPGSADIHNPLSTDGHDHQQDLDKQPDE